MKRYVLGAVFVVPFGVLLGSFSSNSPWSWLGLVIWLLVGSLWVASHGRAKRFWREKRTAKTPLDGVLLNLFAVILLAFMTVFWPFGYGVRFMDPEEPNHS